MKAKCLPPLKKATRGETIVGGKVWCEAREEAAGVVSGREEDDVLKNFSNSCEGRELAGVEIASMSAP